MTLRSTLVALLLLAPGLASAQDSLTLTAPDGQSVSIDRDSYGVPVIGAPTEEALFFGQGFAVAQDRLFQMETFWRSATGRLAELQGAAALTQDRQVRTVYYTPAERAQQFAALSAPVQTMLDAYIAGINVYIDSTAANPATYLPFEYTQVGVAPEAWDRDKEVAVLQFFMRRFGEVGGQELTRLGELDAEGAAWFEANRPINDPGAATTISNAPPPGAVGLNAGPGAAVAGPLYDAADRAFARTGSAELIRRRAASDAFLSGLGVPLKFGSFAATVSADLSDADAMLLGAPQMGAPSETAKAVTSEVALRFPGGNTLRGMTVPGIPGVIIGTSWSGGSSGFTWSLTTGYTDNVDSFLFEPVTAGSYRYAGLERPYDVFTETIRVRGGVDVVLERRRTEQGPVVLVDPAQARGVAYQYAFWNRELDMVEAFYDVWHGRAIDDFEAAARRVTMSFNLLYADTALNTAYWHVGRYPERPGSQDPRLPARADGSGEWVGIVPFEVHPQQRNPTSGLFANWNNKPAPWWNQGDNQNWRPGLRTYDGVTFLQNSLRAAAPSITFEEMQELTRVVRSNGTYDEYPGTYQQVVSFSGTAPSCSAIRMETVVPPGQSGFVSAAGVPSVHFADQWALYQSSVGTGPIQMKDATGQFAFCLPGEETSGAAAFGLTAPAPNPTAGTASLRVRLGSAQAVRVSVVDALGREVAMLHDGPMAAGETPLVVATRGLAPGVYVVRMVGAGSVASQRLIVAR